MTFELVESDSWARSRVVRFAWLAVTYMVVAVGSLGPAWCQEEVGELHGTVSSPSGSPLPGVSITLSGPGAKHVQVSGQKGHFRFLGLDPGEYALSAALDGLATAEYANILIRAGHSVTLGEIGRAHV